MSKSNRVYKIEKRRKELKRQKKKEKKLAKKLEKTGSDEIEREPILQEQKEND